MKTLKKLSLALPAHVKREIVLAEFKKVHPHKFARQHKGRAVEVEIVDIGEERGLLRVNARAWRDGVEVAVDNPLLYHNPPMLVHDGTFDAAGERNLNEDPHEALRQIVLSTLEVTALK